MLLLGAACGGGSAQPGSDAGPDAGTVADGGDAGPTVTLFDPSARPSGLTVDAFNVYWTDSEYGLVDKLQLGAGGQESTIASGISAPSPIVQGGDLVYYGGLQDDGGVWSVSKSGGLPTPIAAGENYVQAMALEPGRLWWSSFAMPHTPSTAQIRSAALDGGAPMTLASNLNYARAIAVEADAVYVASDTLKRIDRADGGITTLSNTTVLSIASDGANIFYGDRSTGALFKINRSGGTPVQLAQLPDGEILSNVWLDRATSTLYVSLFASSASNTPSYGAVYKVQTSGGVLTLVARSFGIAGFGASPLAVDSTTVYFAAGALFTAPK